MTPEEAKALWPKIKAEIPEAIEHALAMMKHPPWDLRRLIEARYLQGCEEFSGDWVGRDPQWFRENADEELADLITYLAMLRVRVHRKA